MRPLALVPTAVAAVFLELKSRREEAWLAERYTEYDEYRRRVRWRFIPGVR
jgi:protein-S-isoprenylcysteine O-methyltransferase Ste14